MPSRSEYHLLLYEGQPSIQLEDRELRERGELDLKHVFQVGSQRSRTKMSRIYVFTMDFPTLYTREEQISLFRSNPNQMHINQLISVFRFTRKLHALVRLSWLVWTQISFSSSRGHFSCYFLFVDTLLMQVAANQICNDSGEGAETFTLLCL